MIPLFADTQPLFGRTAPAEKPAGASRGVLWWVGIAMALILISPYPALVVGLVSACWIILRRPDSVWPVLVWLLPLALLVGVGTFVGWINHAPRHDILRDAYYVCIFLAVLIFAWSVRLLGVSFRQFVWVAVILLTLRYALSGLKLVLAVGAGFGSVDELRDEVGQSSVVTAALLIPSLFLLPGWLRTGFLLSVIPNFLTFGRSNLVTLATIFVTRGNRVLKVLMVLGALAGVGYMLSKPTAGGLIDSYIEKIQFSLQEVGDNNFLGETDIHRKWRAYERFIVHTNIASSDGYTQLMGQGFGAYVNAQILKRRDREGLDRSYGIPAFHDSSLFIELKLGWGGLVVWALWWLWTLWQARRGMAAVCTQRMQYYVSLTMLTIALMMGMFAYGYPLMSVVGFETILLGYLVATAAEQRAGQRAAAPAAGPEARLGVAMPAMGALAKPPA